MNTAGRVNAMHRRTMPVSFVIMHGGRQMRIARPLYFNVPPRRAGENLFRLTIMTRR